MSSNGNPHYEDFLLPPDEDCTLPSGMPCTLRHPTMKYFLSIPSLPSRLVRAVQTKSPLEDIEKAEKEDLALVPADELLTPERIEETETRSNLLLCDVFVRPRFVLHPNGEADTFHPSRLRIEDRTWVLNWASAKLGGIKRGGDADLEGFRSQSPTDEVAHSRL